MRLRIVLLATATLLVGFAVAQATDVRWLGGAVLVVGGAAAAVWGWRWSGPLRALASVAVFAGAFVVAHPLGHMLGPWPAVLLVSVAAGVAAFALLRPRGKLITT